MNTTDLESLKTQAQGGDTAAQLRLGQMYLDGQGVSQDQQEAAQWYAMAADAGHVGGISSLAALYQVGWGVDLDEARALELYEQAAAMGDHHSQLAAAKMIVEGEDKEKDMKRAALWLTMAVEADEPEVDALVLLGLMYHNGDGVEQDHTKAFLLIDKASERGSEAATAMLERMPTDYIIPVAEIGNPAAQLLLGTRYMNGIGINRDFKRAYELYLASAQQGYAGAQYNLGMMYHNGIGRRHDYHEARKWYEMAAQQGHPGAQRVMPVISRLCESEKKPEKKEENKGCSFSFILIGIFIAVILAL